MLIFSNNFENAKTTICCGVKIKIENVVVENLKMEMVVEITNGGDEKS